MTKRKLLKDEIGLIPETALEVFKAFDEKGFEIYLIGGAVRDILLGNEPSECDFTTNATPEETLEIMKDYEPFYENDFGTVMVPIETENEKQVYEITTYRSEKEYSDYRHPDKVEWGKSLEEDVKRRDFTVNTLAIGGGELIDLVDGLKDFEDGVIRAVGEANKRFGEDALRMMRAIRFAAVLGFEIEVKTLEALSTQAPLLEKVSRERVRDELLKILASDYPADGMRLLISTGLMKYVIPEVLEAKEVEQKGHHKLDVLNHMLESLMYCPSSDPLLRLATFLHDVGKPASKRWRCSKCGWVMKEKNLTTGGGLKCSRCDFETDTREATTFYGHEVIGARMVEEIGERLKLSKKQVKKLVIMVRWHMFAYQPEMTDASIRRFIKRVGKNNINDMMLLRIGDRKGGGSKATSWRLEELKKRINEQFNQPMMVKDLVVNGEDVMEILKIEPGPKIGQVMNKLFEEVIEDTSKNKREYLLSRIKEME
ncbi:CCA tRNA nucleotidyltransferase [Patescibacteria group bacterium]|nr:CCA tRNA nucleotidyltransferase [Patescibacteria group bacterium]